jgi:hypothetical protein
VTTHTTKPDPYITQQQRAADWYDWRPSTAPACPRVVAGKRCLTGTGDRLCLCERHRHLLDHGRAWLTPDGHGVMTGEPYDTTTEELADLSADLAPLGLRATVTGRSLWNPGYTLLIIITRERAQLLIGSSPDV